MRKPRAIVIDDDVIILDVFRAYLEEWGYEVLTFREAERCPVYRNVSRCGNLRPCSDVMLIDFGIPKLSSIDLLRAQAAAGCRLAIGNKAVISAYHDHRALAAVRQLGCAAFAKPPVFEAIGAWLAQCEQRIDLALPLGMPRRERRDACASEAACQIRVDHEVFPAMAVNHNSSGLCLRVDRPLLREQIVTILTALKLESYSAVVRWTRATVNNAFLVGVSCC